MTKDHKIIGKGSFGCVITPAISCDARIYKNNKNTVSKVFVTSTNDYTANYHRFKDEQSISAKLKKIDPRHYYFLTGNQSCVLNQSQIQKLPKTVQNCANDNKDNPVHYMFNITMDMGYPLTPHLLPELRKSHKIIHLFAHLVVTIKQIVEKTPYLFMDLKFDNVLMYFRKNKTKVLIHPVLIDFSPEHIIDNANDRMQLRNFIVHFESYDSYSWPPEIKAVKLHHKQPTLSSNQVGQMIMQLERKKNKTYPIKYPKDAHKYIIKAMNQYIYPAIYTKKIRPYIREKIMIWQIGRMFLKVLPKTLQDGKLKSFLRLLQKCVSVNFDARPTCKQILQDVNQILQLPHHRHRPTNYMFIYKPKK